MPCHHQENILCHGLKLQGSEIEEKKKKKKEEEEKKKKKKEEKNEPKKRIGPP